MSDMVEGICSNIDATSTFVREHGPSASGDATIDDVSDATAVSIGRQLNALTGLDIAGANRIIETVTASALPAKSKAAIKGHVNRRLASSLLEETPSIEAPASSPKSTKKQTVENPHFFWDRDDVEYFADTTNVSAQLAVRAMHRMRLIGIVDPSEMCYGNIASAIAAARSPDITTEGLMDLVLALKGAKEKHDGALPYTICPPSALALKEARPDLYAAAYGSNEPAGFTSPHYRAIRSRCFVRDSAKALKGQAKRGRDETPQSASAAASFTQLAASTERLLTAFAQRFVDDGHDPRIVINQEVVNRGRAPSQGNVQSDSQLSGASDSQAIVDGAVASPPGESSHSQMGLHSQGLQPAPLALTLAHASPGGVLPQNDTSPVDVIAGMEASAIDKCTKKGATKRPASDMPASAGEHIAKKPAVAPLMLKKPAGVGKKGFKLGCSRCRGSPVGCLTCRSPGFTGTRFQRPA